MLFDHIAGNSRIKNYLNHMLKKDALSHSLLFTGPEGVGKKLFALAIAKHLLGSVTHPDLHIYQPEGKTGMHGMASMRQLNEEVFLAPFSAQRKVFIVDEADRMLNSSANALLKTFEEPALDSLIILITSSSSTMLPTILSRCFTLHFQPLSVEEISQLLQSQFQLPSSEALSIASQAQGSMHHALQLMKNSSNEEEKIRNLILSQLKRGNSSSYSEVSSFSQKVVGYLENSQELWEKQWKESKQNFLENMNATQKQSMEKEMEGFISLHLMHEFQAILHLILGWYRDMHLIKVNGERTYLMHRDYENEIEQALQRGELKPLENVQEILANAKLALERSTSLSLCIENIFFKP